MGGYHHVSEEHLEHFKWCPSLTRAVEKESLHCFCEAIIYGAMAIIGGCVAYLEFIGARMAHAVSPAADAVHLANDTLSDIVALVIVIVSNVTRAIENKIRRYGAYVQIFLLFVVVIFISFEIREKFLYPSDIRAGIMILVGLLAIIGNGARLLLLNLKKGSWNITRFIQDKHVRTDFYYSIGVVVAGALIYLTSWVWWDTIVAIIILLLIVKMIFVSIKETRIM